MTYRVFWNITKGATHQWVIDTGPNTKRIWIRGLNKSLATFNTKEANNGHPKGWMEVQGNLIIDEKGYASFF